MSSRFQPLALFAFAALMALPAFSQTAAFVQGVVKESDGKIVVGALVAFDSAETKNHIEAKSDKKGHYINSMKPGVYGVTVTVDGKIRARLQQYDAVGGNGDPLNFDLKPLGQTPVSALSAAPAPTSGGGKPSKEDEKAAKDREAMLAKSKELNDTFSAGTNAIDNKQWDEAITQLTKASEIGPTQQAVWAKLAEAYGGSARAAKGADAKAIYEKAFATYDKLLTLAPDEAGTYNNYGRDLALDGRLDEAKIKMAKAIELDPPGAGKYHYNLGAILMNANNSDGATAEFRSAITADPNYAEAYFQLGSVLVGKTTMDAAGKMVPPAGTIDALQKYLQLKPDGPNAPAAKDMITALGSVVTTNFKDPNAPAKTNKKGK